MLKLTKKHFSRAVATGLAITAISVSAAGSWRLYITSGYSGSGSPYEFTNRLGCSWNYTTSYGGWGGVQHLYTANGSCPHSEQQVNISFSQSSVSIYHR